MDEGMKVYVKTTSGRNYTGKIISRDLYFLNIIDKYDSHVSISLKEIEIIQEVKE